MGINRVEIKDFLVFKGEFALEFCPGINVLIGGNATGKTTLLRGMYAVREHSGNCNDFINVASYFRGPNSHDEVEKNNISINKLVLIHSNDSVFSSVYIPEKDLLSNSRKLPESVEYGDLQFTRCEIDLIKKARVAAQKPLQSLVKSIYNIIGGVASTDGESFFVRRDGIQTPIPFSMEASGYRKFGLLALLIRNEQIKPGSTLFWDEPENSLNPELIPALVDILHELSRNGTQIFVATHSYDVARWLEFNRTEDSALRYISLRKEGGGIAANVADDYASLSLHALAGD